MELKGYLGVYSSVHTRNNQQKIFVDASLWLSFVWEKGQDNYMVQPLDKNFKVTSTNLFVSQAELEQYFVFQPHILIIPLEVPEESSGDSFRGEAHETILFGKLLPYSKKAIYEAVKLDSEMRFDFAVALTNYKQGGKPKAIKVFENLIVQPDLIPPHKHVCTSFGTELRRLGLHTLALKMYKRVLELEPEDIHARCNLGRIYFELNQFTNATKCMREVLRRAPNLKYAQKLLQAINAKQRLPSQSNKKISGKVTMRPRKS